MPTGRLQRRARVRRAALALGALLALAAAPAARADAAPDADPEEWIDEDTPDSARTKVINGVRYELVMSDEFEQEGRTFFDGDDPIWTGLESPVYSNYQYNAYNSSLATTKGGKLLLSASEQDWHWEHDRDVMRHYQTPMLQTWNKFCFTEGYVELSAKMPGRHDQSGLWPAFWMMGNLGRATFKLSTDHIWPFNYDQCPAQPDHDANQYGLQELDACNNGTGRGAPEIDIVEVMPGSFRYDYGANKLDSGACDSVDEGVLRRIDVALPMVATSVQAGPGQPHNAKERPRLGCLPRNVTGPDGRSELEYYPELYPSAEAYGPIYGTAYNVSINYEFWGDDYCLEEGYGHSDCPQGKRLHTDAFSAITGLGRTHFEEQHLYQCEVVGGADGFVRFTLDGAQQFHVPASVLTTERRVTFDPAEGLDDGTLLPREVPTEPMYLILNLDMSPRWGWPYCDESLCECCVDCKRTECTTCIVDGVNTRQWLAELCEMLPVAYEVEYVRVYQREGARNVGCDPPARPTRAFIEAHRSRYMPILAEDPTKPLTAGGATCNEVTIAAEDEGGEEAAEVLRCGAHGTCVPAADPTAPNATATCACDEGWTGPRCLVRAKGWARRCARIPARGLGNESAGVHAGTCLTLEASSVDELFELIELQCARARNASAEAAAACDDVAPGGRYFGCSVRQRANHVLRVWSERGTGGAECCNLLVRTLQCQALRPAWTAYVVLAGVLWACLLVPLVRPRVRGRVRRSCARRLGAARAAVRGRLGRGGRGAAPGGAAGGDAVQPVHAACGVRRASLIRAAETAAEFKPSEPGDCAPRPQVCQTSQEQLQALFKHLGRVFGFQRDSVHSQYSHLLQLWHAQTAACGDEYDAATQLHQLMFESFERWLDTSAGLFSFARRKRVVFVQWRAPSHVQRLHEMALYLCLWGEAGNIRFCPEILCFFFECARNHNADKIAPASTEHDTFNSEHADYDAWEESEPKEADAPPGTYLTQYVRPLYAHIFDANFSGFSKKRAPLERPFPEHKARQNYDDWNEMTWTPERIGKIVDKEGLPIVDWPAAERWARLAEADWARSLSGCKRHAEVHSWHCCFVAYVRVVTVHFVSFYGLYLLALRRFSFGTWAEPASELAVYAGFLVPGLVHLVADMAKIRIKPGSSVWHTLLDADKSLPYVIQVSLFATLARLPNNVVLRVLYVAFSTIVMLRTTFRPPGIRRKTAQFDAHMYAPRGTLMPMALFWLIVFAAKSVTETQVILRAAAVATARLEAAQPLRPLFQLRLHWELHGSRALIARVLQQSLVWFDALCVHCSSTYYWYVLGVCLFGTARGAYILHGANPTCARELQQLRRLSELPAAAVRRIFAFDKGAEHGGRASASDEGLHPSLERKWARLWNAIVHSMFETDLLSLDELRRLEYGGVDGRDDADAPPAGLQLRSATGTGLNEPRGGSASLPGAPLVRELLVPEIFREERGAAEGGGARKHVDALLPASSEARRRLTFFMQTLGMARMPSPLPVEALPTFSVLIPHYGETILVSEKELAKAEVGAAGGGGRSAKAGVDPAAQVPEPLISLLMEYFPDELNNFRGRVGEGAWSFVCAHLAGKVQEMGDRTAARRLKRMSVAAKFGRRFSLTGAVGGAAAAAAGNGGNGGNGGAAAAVGSRHSSVDGGVGGRRGSASSAAGGVGARRASPFDGVRRASPFASPYPSAAADDDDDDDSSDDDGGVGASELEGGAALAGVPDTPHKKEEALLELRKWASHRTQSLYRTVAGMMAFERAYDLLLQAQRPALSRAERRAIVSIKFSCVVSMQRYHHFDDEYLGGVEAMLEEWPKLKIAYIEEEDAPSAPHGVRYYSCLIDGSCKHRSDNPLRRVPRYRVELPGHPILGDGKGDNQNHALIYVRGRLLQTIDANQEGYLEEALKVGNVLAEFGAEINNTRERVSIVGFREHIYSALGTVANFSATSEYVFGTMMQRTMDRPLLSRQYYGHPDIMEKLTMMAQGGVSKATKGLNLSEDVFAGMDLMLRGGNVVHREYFQVGKGREMSFVSQMKFVSKLSRGAAEMTLTRQSYRLGTRLQFSRMLGFYYAHTGYYLSPVLMELSIWVFAFTLLYFVLCDLAIGHVDYALSGGEPSASYASIASALIDAQFGPLLLLFVTVQAMPLFFELSINQGVIAAVVMIGKQLLTFSWMFFAFQAQLTGYSFKKEISSGGASYIATGRSMSATRQPLSALYRAFGQSNMLPGADLAAILALALSARPIVLPGFSFWLAMGSVVLSWLYAPFVFNPHQFALRRLLAADVRDGAAFLLEPGADGWVAWARAELAANNNRPYTSYIVPGRRTMALCALLALARDMLIDVLSEAETARATLELFLFASPLPAIVLVALVAFGARACARACRSEAALRGVHVLCALALLCAHGVELWVLLTWGSWGRLVRGARPRSPAAAHAAGLVLLCLRYLSAQVGTSVMAWLVPATSDADDGADLISASRRLLATARFTAQTALHDTVLAYWALVDLVLFAGVALPSLVLACLPGITTLHTLLLFRVLPDRDIDAKAAKVTKSSGRAAGVFRRTVSGRTKSRARASAATDMRGSHGGFADDDDEPLQRPHGAEHEDTPMSPHCPETPRGRGYGGRMPRWSNPFTPRTSAPSRWSAVAAPIAVLAGSRRNSQKPSRGASRGQSPALGNSRFPYHRTPTGGQGASRPDALPDETAAPPSPRAEKPGVNFAAGSTPPGASRPSGDIRPSPSGASRFLQAVGAAKGEPGFAGRQARPSYTELAGVELEEGSDESLGLSPIHSDRPSVEAPPIDPRASSYGGHGAAEGGAPPPPAARSGSAPPSQQASSSRLRPPEI